MHSCVQVCLFAAATSAAPAADADPALLYTHGLHGALPYAGLPYAAHHGVLGVAPAIPHVSVVKSVVEKPAEVAVKTVAHPVAYTAGVYGYPYAGLHHGLGAVHVVKREADADASADAEADPYLLYGYGGGYPYASAYSAYSGYPYGYRSAYHGYPYNLWG